MASQLAKARVVWTYMFGACVWAYCNGLGHFMRSLVERRESNTRNTADERARLVVTCVMARTTVRCRDGRPRLWGGLARASETAAGQSLWLATHAAVIQTAGALRDLPGIRSKRLGLGRRLCVDAGVPARCGMAVVRQTQPRTGAGDSNGWVLWDRLRPFAFLGQYCVHPAVGTDPVATSMPSPAMDRSLRDSGRLRRSHRATPVDRARNH